MIKRNMYYELSRPEQSGFRWGKIYNRQNLLFKFYKNRVQTKEYPCVKVDSIQTKLVKNLLKYIKSKELPIIDSYALKLYKNIDSCCCRINKKSNFISILSDAYENTKNDIVKILEKQLGKEYEVIVEHHNVYTDILNPRCCISILHQKEVFNIITIIDCNNNCFSVQKIKGYTVGSVDTILYFLYSALVLNHIYMKDRKINTEIMHYINEYEKYIESNFADNAKKRLHVTCYGDIHNEKDIQLNWKQRMTIKYL